MNRRDFLKKSMTVGAALAAAPVINALPDDVFVDVEEGEEGEDPVLIYYYDPSYGPPRQLDFSPGTTNYLVYDTERIEVLHPGKNMPTVEYVEASGLCVEERQEWGEPLLDSSGATTYNVYFFQRDGEQFTVNTEVIPDCCMPVSAATGPITVHGEFGLLVYERQDGYGD